MFRSILTVAALTAVTAATPGLSRAADAFAYEAVGNGDFGLVDLSTGVFTLRGNSGGQLAGLGEGPDGTLYGAFTDGGTLLTVDPTNGAVNAVGPSGITYIGFGSTLSQLFGYGRDNNLYAIDRNSGGATLLGPTHVGISGYFGFSAGSSTLYELHNGDVYTLDTTSGAATLIGSSATGLFGAAASVGGILYAGSEVPLQVYSLDPSNGAGVAGAAVTGTSQIFYGLASIGGSVPEPATWAMMFAGTLGVGVLMRRRFAFLSPRAT